MTDLERTHRRKVKGYKWDRNWAGARLEPRDPAVIEIAYVTATYVTATSF